MKKENSLETSKSERNIAITLSKLVALLVIIIVGLIIERIVTPPKIIYKPYFVEFKTSDENYVIVRAANQTILSDKAVANKEIKGYVEARESINKGDEKEKWTNVIRLKSSDDIWNSYIREQDIKEALWNKKGFVRTCEVTNISNVRYEPKLNQYISIVSYTLKDEHSNEPIQILKMKTTVIFHFIDKKISNKNLLINPLGTEITAYSQSEISELKGEN
ncbi:MAG: hypothetical protein DRG78_00750 [Epsilonproteobacteria bacterium]|nr:MAG: hypothetical protein DRG78_00750 [Campylobacterota bacterium]